MTKGRWTAPEWLKAVAFVAVMVAASVLIASALTAVFDDPVPTDDEPQVVVVPMCSELERSGYDGRMSCIDDDGDLVRPGG